MKQRVFIQIRRRAFVVVSNNNADTLHYVLKDHLGSWTVITDEEGAVEQELSYDAWGNLRNPGTWCVDATIRPMFDRGYTGHEHHVGLGLINMNGRMYDPVMSSFLSVDRYVQSPGNSQGFNRYAYCMYNPLKYTDPSGWRCGPPVSKSALIRDFFEDPCIISRQALRDAGLYEIEGGFAYSQGFGAVCARWKEGDGSAYQTSWSVQTESSEFGITAWAIPEGQINCGTTNYYDYYGNVESYYNNSSGFSSGGGGCNAGLGYGTRGSFRQAIFNQTRIKYEVLTMSLGAKIASYAGSEFNRKLFWNYWYGNGDYTLSKEEFDDIAGSAIAINDPVLTVFDGIVVKKQLVSLYQSDYANSIGSAYIYYDYEGHPIAFYDEYDFNLGGAKRPLKAQVKTGLVKTASLVNVHSKPFNIKYP